VRPPRRGRLQVRPARLPVSHERRHDLLVEVERAHVGLHVDPQQVEAVGVPNHVAATGLLIFALFQRGSVPYSVAALLDPSDDVGRRPARDGGKQTLHDRHM
jgi:hypothetical protein